MLSTSSVRPGLGFEIALYNKGELKFGGGVYSLENLAATYLLHQRKSNVVNRTYPEKFSLELLFFQKANFSGNYISYSLVDLNAEIL